MLIAKSPLTEPIPGYRLIEPLGKGGFGEVWKCEAPGGLFKAVKFINDGGDNLAGPNLSGAEQELRALQLIKSIRHPFLLSIERVEVVDGEVVIIMELADRSLHDLLVEYRAAGRPGIPRRELLGYLREAAEAIDVLNQEYGLQHLDIKPRNLFLIGQHVKVADFGLVTSLTEMQNQANWRNRSEMVTPLYSAPETFLGKVTLFSDQYSLAIAYQELQTGILPFTGRNYRQLALRHVQQPPDLQSLPEAERPVVARALAKEPRERFPSCAAFMEALRALPDVASPPAARKPGTDAEIQLGELAATPASTPARTPAPPSVPTKPAERIEACEDPALIEMKRRIAEQLAAAAGGWEIRSSGSLRYRFRRPPGKGRTSAAPLAALEHFAYGRVLTALAPLKLSGFEQEWRLQRVERVNDESRPLGSPTTWLYQLPLPTSLWQRWRGRAPALLIRIDLVTPAATTEEVSDLILSVCSDDCSPERGSAILDELGPRLLQSVRDYLQLPPDRRGEERITCAEDVRIFPVEGNSEIIEGVAARLRNISRGGVGLELPYCPPDDRLLVQFRAAQGEPLVVPVQLLNLHPRDGGHYLVGGRFAWEIVPNNAP